MWKDIIVLVLGMGLLVLGGNWVTDGSASVARRLKMSGLLVGLTVVALGSATPDLVVGIFSTINDKSQFAVGDVVGSAIFDFLLVIGIIAIVKPIKIGVDTLRSQLPVAILACWILFFLADDTLIDQATANIIDRSDGLVFLTGLGLFVAYTIMSAKAVKTTAPGVPGAPDPVTSAPAPAKEMPVWKAVACIIGGLGALVLGGQWFVDGASGIATRSGMSEALVGLTVVAIGGSLPDLATSLIAAIKNQPGIALGNIIGGTIYNVLLVLGTCAVISPLRCGTISQIDFLSMLGAAVLALIFAATGPRKIHVVSRGEGIILVVCYVAYMTYIILNK